MKSFSLEKIKKSITPSFFNNITVSKAPSHKHLGLTLDSKLSFSYHINEKIRKTKRLIGILKYLSRYLPLKTLDLIYKSFIRPHLDYADIIFHIPQSPSLFDSSITLTPLMDKIERVQYQAALAITGCWQGSNQSKLYEELGWESLSDRRWARRLLQFYKIKKGLTPAYLQVTLPHERALNVRNSNTILHREFRCNTTRYKNSFFPDTVRSYNNIGHEFTSSPSLSIFKKRIFNLIRPASKFNINIIDPVGLRFLFQLRIGLSPLKYHKKRHNFNDTTNDWCDCHSAIENTSHFLFYCPLYSNYRISLYTSVHEILRAKNLMNLSTNVDLYLYGHFSLEHVDNKSILISTITFLKETKRFS